MNQNDKTEHQKATLKTADSDLSSVSSTLFVPISCWQANERPREKLLARGASALSDAELLAIFLRTGTRGKTAIDLARELLSNNGGLGALFSADQQQFCQSKGVGTAKYVQLQAVLEMSRRYLQSTIERNDVFNNALDVKRYLKLKLNDYPYEVFACLFLDNKHRLIQYEELFRGTIDSSAVHPREVVRSALRHNAAAIILSHNHPSGVAEPSQSDIAITEKLTSALKLIDVRVLDHVIVGDELTSFAERGLI